ncbi:flippase-like domain-containing protein [archaeon]|nr:flippase-like domain-containing protein [archaeon]
MKKQTLGLVFLVWILAVAFAFSHLDLTFDAGPLEILYALVALFVIHVLWAWNWKVLNKAAGLKHEYKTLFKGTFIAAFTDTVTPQLTPSAELATAYYLKCKFGGKATDYLPIVFLESSTSFLCQVVIFFGATLWMGGLFNDTLMYLIGALLALFIFVGLAWKLRRTIMNDILKLSLGHVTVLDNIMDGIISLTSKRKSMLFQVISVIVLSLLVEASVIYVLLRGFTLDTLVGFVFSPEIFLIVLIAFMGSRILTLFTLVPGGVGVSEISMSALLLSISAALSVIVFEPSKVLSAVIIYRTLFFWLNIFLGSYFTGHEVYSWLNGFKLPKFVKSK